MSGRRAIDRPQQLLDAAWLRDRYEGAGLSTRVIADELGTTAPTVQRALRNHGIALRSTAESKVAQYARRPLPLIPGQVPLRTGDGRVRAWATVDVDDWLNVLETPWSLNAHGYAQSNRYGLLHRFILGLDTDDPQVDHWDQNPLNNRRSNLRLVTPAEQCQNHPARGGSSEHRGVHWHRSANRWVARYGQHYIGAFSTEYAAAHAASEWRRRHLPYSWDAEPVE